MRYAVSHAVGRQAASAKVSSAGFGTRLRRGTATRSANVPSYRSDSSERFGSIVSSPRKSSDADHGVHDHLVAVLVDPRAVAAEHHRQLLVAQADAPQAPQVVVVERGGPQPHGHPALAVSPGPAARRAPEPDSGSSAESRAA